MRILFLKVNGGDAALIFLILLLQFSTIAVAEDAPEPSVTKSTTSTPVINQTQIKLDVVRASLANIEAMHKQALADIEARYIRDKENRTKFYQTKEDELKAKEKALVDELEKSKI